MSSLKIHASAGLFIPMKLSAAPPAKRDELTVVRYRLIVLLYRRVSYESAYCRSIPFDNTKDYIITN